MPDLSVAMPTLATVRPNPRSTSSWFRRNRGVNQSSLPRTTLNYGLRLLIAIVAFLLIGVTVAALADLLGWQHPIQQSILNLALSFLFFGAGAWVLKRNVAKGMTAFLLILNIAVILFSVATIIGSLLWLVRPNMFGVETAVMVEDCRPQGDRFECVGSVVGESIGPSDVIHLSLDGARAKGDIIRGTAYTSPDGSAGGFAVGGRTPPRPPLIEWMVLGTVLLVVSSLSFRFLLASFCARDGSPPWHPATSHLRKPQAEKMFRTVALGGAVIVTALCGASLMAQLGALSNGEVKRLLGFSVGDWMTVDGVLLALVAWGYRKTRTPFDQKVVVSASRASVVGMAGIFLILVLQQGGALIRPLIVVGTADAFDTLAQLTELRRVFDTPTLLATAGLLFTVYLMTLQFFETNAELGTSIRPSALTDTARDALDSIGTYPETVQANDFRRDYPEYAAYTEELRRLGLLTQNKKILRLTPKGRAYVRAGSSETTPTRQAKASRRRQRSAVG